MGDLIEEVLDVFGLGFSAMHSFIASPRPQTKKNGGPTQLRLSLSRRPLVARRITTKPRVSTVTLPKKKQSDIRTFLVTKKVKGGANVNDGLLTEEALQYFMKQGWSPDGKQGFRHTCFTTRKNKIAPLFEGATGELSDQDLEKFFSMEWNTTSSGRKQKTSHATKRASKDAFQYYRTRYDFKAEEGLMSDDTFDQFVQWGWSPTQKTYEAAAVVGGGQDTPLQRSISSSAMLEAAEHFSSSMEESKIQTDMPDEWEYVMDGEEEKIDDDDDDDFSHISDDECVYAVHSFEMIV